ncbi:FAD-dependent oxidoreductase [Streptomyces flavofungini]|uniref:FAD-dependent oxidoreductase n=1 Tax=Streptomyces flavofungini TaxID=68200 RepID=UPI0025B18E49|nr:FAD-dependent oxidoreductase [Streptomyces flavofungini]WJV51767.1 oxidoreductase [Streptomyces flavofungini]
MSSPSYDADLLIVGAGPAGVAAAVMAASLQLRTLVVEAERVGEKLHRIGPVENVPGNWSTGPELAHALERDLERLQTAGRCSVVRARAAAVAARDKQAELTLDDGQLLCGRAVVVAAGVAELVPSDAAWLSAPDDFVPAPLWRAVPQDLAGRTYVLGGDRPLGTWLRAYSDTRKQLHVLCPPGDDYKTAEVAADDRVRIVPVAHVALARSAYGPEWTVRVKDREGKETSYAVDTVLNNLGTKPTAFDGLVQDADGYCPPRLQRPRILTVGDIRSGRYQRIVTSQGSGAEASLSVYYDLALPRP